MKARPEDSLRSFLARVTAGQSLSAHEMSELVEILMQVDLEQPPFCHLASGLICSLKTRGETAEEIVGAASCLRQHQIPVNALASNGVVLDTCGTGGDGANLINVSTLTGLVMASLGVMVAKHGNRSVSSACGSADLLEEMNYPLLSQERQVTRCLEETGFGFLFAPHFHPALKNLAGLRRLLGVRTVFNMLGPLVNPAGVTHQLIGVFDRSMVTPIAKAGVELGLKRCLVVHGQGGLDELAPHGQSWVTLAEGDRLEEMIWSPDTFGAKTVPLAALQGGDARHNAACSAAMLEGRNPEAASAVALNCAAALWLVQETDSLKEGYDRAMEQILSGRVGHFFERARAAAEAATRTD